MLYSRELIHLAKSSTSINLRRLGNADFKIIQTLGRWQVAQPSKRAPRCCEFDQENRVNHRVGGHLASNGFDGDLGIHTE
jgi:hypothetical protein